MTPTIIMLNNILPVYTRMQIIISSILIRSLKCHKENKTFTVKKLLMSTNINTMTTQQTRHIKKPPSIYFKPFTTTLNMTFSVWLYLMLSPPHLAQTLIFKSLTFIVIRYARRYVGIPLSYHCYFTFFRILTNTKIQTCNFYIYPQLNILCLLYI